MYSFGGNSGSPIFWKSNYADASSAFSVIGIHKGTLGKLKYGILLSQVENEMIEFCKIITMDSAASILTKSSMLNKMKNLLELIL